MLSAPASRFGMLALLLVVAAVLTQTAQTYFLAGSVYGTAALQSYATTPNNSYGVNAFLEDDVYQWQLDRDYAAIVAGGYHYVRQEFLWSQIEPSAKGNFYDAKNKVDAWAKWDRIVQGAVDHHVELIVRLDFAPDWATAGNVDSGQCPTLCAPPNDPRDFADFARAVASRYQGKVHFYQVWNEPNLQHDWAGTAISPAHYVAMLQDTYQAIKGVDPGAMVLSASLAPNRGDSPQNISDLTYLQGMYAAGAKPYFDILGAQAYGLNSPTDDRQIGLHSYQFPRAILPGSQPFTFDRPVQLHQIMLAAGDGAKQVWVTEFGWMSLPLDWSGNPSPWSQVPAADKDHYTTQAWSRAATDWPWMGVLCLWYLRTPVPTDPRDPTPYFAILQPDWQPTPLFEAVQAQAAQPPVALTGSHGASDAAATYGPHGFAEAWHSGQNGKVATKVAGAPGANMSLRFSGNALYLLVSPGPSGGMARVTIDQSPSLANLVPQQANGQHVIDTFATEPQAPRYVAIASDLPASSHLFELEVLSAHNPSSRGSDVAIAGFGVTVDQPAIWTYLYALLATCAGVLVLWPVTASARSAWLRLLPRVNGMRGVSHLSRLWVTSARLAPREALAWSAAWAIALIAFYLPQSLVWSVPGLLLIALLGLWRPTFGVLFVPVTASLEFLPKMLGGHQVSLFEVLVVVVTAGVIVRAMWDRHWPVRPTRVTLLVVGLTLVGVISLVASQYQRYSLRELLSVIVEPGLYCLAALFLLQWSQRRWLAVSVVATGCAVSAAAIVAALLGHGIIQAQGVWRFAGVYPSPDNLALFVERTFAFTVAWAVVGAKQPRWTLLVLAALQGVVVLLTFTRGAWIASAIVLALGAVLWNRKVLLLLAGAAVAGGFAALITHTQRLTSLLNVTGSSTTAMRLYLWRSSWAMARDHWLQGIGLDNFLYDYGEYRLPEAAAEPFLSHPHNVVFDFWLSLGMLGLVWLGCAVAMIVYLMRRAWRLAVAERPLTAGWTAMLVIGALHGFVDNSFFLTDLAVLFWVPLAGLELAGTQSGPASDSVSTGKDVQ